MKSIRNIYKIGMGPSSSHTMGPRFAAQEFAAKTKGAHSYKVTLYGSLAATGKGHLTDHAICQGLNSSNVEIEWKAQEFLPYHPNGMKFVALDAQGKEIEQSLCYSIGGGDVVYDEDKGEVVEKKSCYSLNKMEDILGLVKAREFNSFWEFVYAHEDDDLPAYLGEVWDAMQASVRKGLVTEGTLQGGLNIQRKACSYKIKSNGNAFSMQRHGLVFANALAVAEENAGGGIVVTAPTCGSAGVLPAVLYSLQEKYDFETVRIVKALATAGLIAALVKKNASVAGADVGCQGEVGVACSMAAAAACQLFGGSPYQIEYAATMGLEHFLGLTCDPVRGLVQVPCIERNALAAARALSCSAYASLSDGNHFVGFDKVVRVMLETGHDLPNIYKETSLGGLAKD